MCVDLYKINLKIAIIELYRKYIQHLLLGPIEGVLII